MKNLAPHITRQKLLLEGFYEVEIDEQKIKDYFNEITSSLELRIYSEPIIYLPGGEGKEDNQGYDAFVPLIDSGISLYIWENHKFFSIIIYTCKSFNEIKAIEVTKEFFKSENIEKLSF